MLAVAIALTGCHQRHGTDATRPTSNPPGGDPRHSRTSSRAPALEPPRILPWAPPDVSTVDWQFVIGRLGGETALTYRVPIRWSVEHSGRTVSGDGVVRTSVERTDVVLDRLSLSDYLDQLAGHQPVVRLLRHGDGTAAYVLEREVKLAPNEPNSASYVFHTAVLVVRGRVVKLDVRYPREDKWRYEKIASAVIGTMTLQRPPM